MTVPQFQQVESSDRVIMALFARMDTWAMSAAFAIIFAFGLAIATAVLLMVGASEGLPIGPNLSALGNILPGYSVSWTGLPAGAISAGVIGAAAGFLFAVFWNFSHIVALAGMALVRPHGNAHAELIGESGGASTADSHLTSAISRLNVQISAIGIGLGSGLLLFLATRISLAVAERPGYYLNLLGVFAPGYSASPEGSWFGLLWGVLYGALIGGAVTALYDKSVAQKLPEFVFWDKESVQKRGPPVLLLSSRALGLALGVAAAVQLILATSWLILRGTAEESVHARLLSNYLPGYSVTYWGALLGGFDLFLVAYVASLAFGTTYNAVANLRNRGQS